MWTFHRNPLNPSFPNYNVNAVLLLDLTKFMPIGWIEWGKIFFDIIPAA
jgi:hypothetical protein